MECAVTDSTIAKKCYSDARLIEQLEGVSCAGCLQNAGTDNSTRPHESHFGREQMHAAAAPKRDTRDPTH